MLVLSRRADESFVIEIDPQTTDETTLSSLFAHGPIEITVLATGISYARIGIQLPKGLRLKRSELINKSSR
ncbi:MAG: carbon storage regulator [Xanthomonadales bacterium]|jgi:sRNA-binding carbon storage regulator CsrA|nr:carbon storage regulator [Xanthomonadales bacterium]